MAELEKCEHCGTSLPADLPTMPGLVDETTYVRCPACDLPCKMSAKQEEGKPEPEPATEPVTEPETPGSETEPVTDPDPPPGE